MNRKGLKDLAHIYQEGKDALTRLKEVDQELEKEKHPQRLNCMMSIKAVNQIMDVALGGIIFDLLYGEDKDK